MNKYTLLPFFTIGLAALVVVLLLVIRALNRRRNNSKDPFVSADKLQSSLRDERLRSEIILGAIEDGVVLIDRDEIIQSFNQGAANITGWTMEEAKSLDWKSVFKFVDDKGIEISSRDSPIQKLFDKGQTIRDNTANISPKSGSRIIALNLTVSALMDAQKRVTGAVAIFRDVSQERRQEQQRAEFISTASHEMRTPVAAIEGYLSLALNDKVSTIDTRARGYLEKAHASTQHLGQLFQDLLTSAKAEDGRLSNHPTVVEMGSYLEQIVDGLKFAADKKNLSLDFVIGSSSKTIDASHKHESDGMKVLAPLYYAYADPDRLREVITNLFDNAVKYTDTGKVSVGLTGNDQVVQFYIRDTGHGIPAEDIPHLFQKFYRVDNSATRTIGGTGLGLFICRKIIELYSGRIWVESEINKGSTFFINLPRLTSQKAELLMSAAPVADGKVVTPAPSLTVPAS